MQNYFSIFNLPPSFDLNLPVLEKSYFEAQRKFHPDRLVGKAPKERMAAIQQSMLANEAYEALKSPLTRARHLLTLQGITIGSEPDSVKPSQALLVETMESREALAGADKAQLAMLENQNKENTAKTLNALNAAFVKQDFQTAAGLVIRLGYLEKLGEEIRIRKKNTV